VPGLKYAMFMFCDHNGKDLHRSKEDRFTMITAPPFVIFVMLPLAWRAIKIVWSVIIWCCAVNEYVEVEEEEDGDDIIKKDK